MQLFTLFYIYLHSHDFTLIISNYHLTNPGEQQLNPQELFRFLIALSKRKDSIFKASHDDRYKGKDRRKDRKFKASQNDRNHVASLSETSKKSQYIPESFTSPYILLMCLSAMMQVCFMKNMRQW
jgi:hypothetical protein